jgi:hypothetical protein
LGKEVWDAINSVFDVLPLAAVIDDKVGNLFREGFIKSMLSIDSLLTWWYSESNLMSR